MKSTFWILLLFCYKTSTDACNETIVLNETEMNLTSPGYPEVYQDNEDCWWNIESSSPNMVIGIHIAVMDIENSGLCSYDNVTFYDGWNASAPVLSRMCGDEAQTNVVSSGNVLYISFKTDDTVVGKGFVLKIFEFDKDAECGGKLTATSQKQTLELPKYFLFFRLDILCKWTITAQNENNTVAITTHFGSDGWYILPYCQRGDIKFYNGNTTYASDIINAVCQGNPASSIRSSRNIMTIVYRAVGYDYSGLALTYRSVPATNCSRTIVATSSPQFLMSPGYPDAYYNNLNCTIKITSVTNYIRIEMLSVDIEGSAPQCNTDSLTFYDDESLKEKQLTLCGNSSRRVVYSADNTMAMQFRTDSHTVKKGYRIMVTSVLQVPHVTNCGNTSLIATSVPQYLTSPNYPRHYENNDQCTWNITAAHPGMKIRLVLEDTDIESSGLNFDRCIYDYLKAFDGYMAASTLFMTLCGVSKPVAQSKGSVIQLVFKADDSSTKRGFKLKYFETNETYLCGAHVQADSGMKLVTSPNWPGNYPNNQNCRWTIQGPRNTNINLSAEFFSVEETSNCAYDYVEIYDGLGSIPPYTTKLCGSDTYNYVSSGNSLTIIFHSDNSRTRMGFKYGVRAGHFSSYSTVTQDLYASYIERHIVSPNYPFHYPTNAKMMWKIDTNDKNYRVTVSFDTISVDYSTSCSSNYVEAFDGYSDSASSLGKFCGHDTSTKTSSGRYMFLKFKSGSSSGPGFKLTYTKEYHFASDDYSSTNVGPIIGGIIGGVAIIFIVVIIIGSIASKRNQGPTVRSVQQNNMYTISSRALEERVPATFMPPPSYSVATAGDSANNDPPPYSQVALDYKNNS